MIKILHAIADPRIGGAEILLEALAEHTDRRKFHFSVLFPKGAPSPRISAEKAELYEVQAMPYRSFSPADILPIRKAILRLRPDVLFTHGWLTPRIAAKIPPTPRKAPVCISVKHCAASRLSAPLLYRSFTDMTVATAQNAYRLLAECGIPSEEIALIPNGARRFSQNEEERNALRKKYRIPQGCVAVGLAARLTPIKGHDTLLDAAACLRYAPFCFLLLGDGELKAHIAQRICKEKLTNVRLLGEWEDPAPFYRMLDIALSCSLGSETASLSLGESLGAGIPTLASDIPGNRALVGAGGLLFPPGNSAALAETLIFMRENLPCFHAAAALRGSALPTPEETCRLYEGLALRAATASSLQKRGEKISAD